MRKEWLVLLMPPMIAGVLYASNCMKLRTSRENKSSTETLESITATTSYLRKEDEPSQPTPVGPAPIIPPVRFPTEIDSPLISCITKCEYDNGMGIYAESCIEGCFEKYNY